MISDLTPEQQEVLAEFVRNVKNESWIRTADMYKNQMVYDLNHGKGESIELLNRHFYELIETHSLNADQGRKLAKNVYRRENIWTTATEHGELDTDEVIKDGFGYVKLADGTRVDDDEESYKEDRDRYNARQAERLKNHRTNGIEFLE